MRDADDSISERNLEKYFGDYRNLPFENIQEEYRRREVLKTLSNGNFMNLLEVGCGRHSLLQDMQKETTATIVEPIPEFIQMNEKYLLSQKTVQFFCGRLSDYVSTGNREHDICVLSSLLHEVDDQNQLLQDCRNALCDNGRLIVVVPNAFSIHRILGVERGFSTSVYDLTETQKTMQQLNIAFSVETLSKLVSQNGFSVTHAYTFLPKLLSHSQMYVAISEGKISEEFVKQLNELSTDLEPFGSEILLVGNKIA